MCVSLVRLLALQEIGDVILVGKTRLVGVELLIGALRLLRSLVLLRAIARRSGVEYVIFAREIHGRLRSVCFEPGRDDRDAHFFLHFRIDDLARR